MNNTERKHYRETLVAVPDELKTLPNWVCYRLEYRSGQSKPTKIPYNPITGDPAKSNDSSTWSDYETCVTAVEHGDYHGVGFEFSPPYVGVDLDHCRDAESGAIEDWAQEIVDHLNSYAEISPSGTGVHVIIKGTLPHGRRRIGPVEMYDSARFFTVTGHHLPGTAADVEERTGEVGDLHEALFPTDPTSAELPAKVQDSERDSLSDEHIIEKASNASNGERFKKLFAGEWQGDYDSQSEADQALCCHLAFWAGKDLTRMDSIFRRSGLYRKKWEREDYRADTLAGAIDKTAETYRPSKRDRLEQLYAKNFHQENKSRSLPAPEAPLCVEERTEISLEQPQQSAGSSFEDFRYSLTDLGNSERLIRQHGQNLRYCVETGTWHLWTGSRWEPDTLRQVHQLAKATVREIYDELPLETDKDKREALYKFIQRSESERSLNAMVNLAKTDPRIAIRVAAFNTQPHLLNCKNGTIDLRTGRLLPHCPADLITKQCPVDFDPEATSEIWEHFLHDCTRGDADLQSFLQRAVGYTLYGDPREQVILMVHGPGATGKSTFIAAVMNVLGDYATTADFTTFLKKDRVTTGPSDDIANLAGARLVSSVEVDDGKQLAQALLKQLTGGDVIRARHLYQSSFEFRPQFSLWLVCNHAPAIAHDDDAIWRRMLRLPFDNFIPESKRDLTLKTTLTDPAGAAPAVLAWAVKGCVEWYSNGLQIPATVRKATESYKELSNPLADFVADECLLNTSAYTKVADLRQAYDSWCSENGEKHILNRNQFADAIRELGCTPELRSGARVWLGIALRANAASIYTAIRKQPTSATSYPFEEDGSMPVAT